MEFKITDQDGHARLGQLTLTHGLVETPVFMPVGTCGAVKSLTQDDLTGLGAQIILANTFRLMLRQGTGVIKPRGGGSIVARLAACPLRQNNC